jgi:hypothetical protein
MRGRPHPCGRKEILPLSAILGSGGNEVILGLGTDWVEGKEPQPPLGVDSEDRQGVDVSEEAQGCG